MQMWRIFHMFLVLDVWFLGKSKLWLFFLLNFLSKFIDMYWMDTALSFILLVTKMLKISRVKGEAHLLKKLAFVTNKSLAQDAFRKWQEQTFQNPKKYNSKKTYVMYLLTLKRLTLHFTKPLVNVGLKFT